MPTHSSDSRTQLQRIAITGADGQLGSELCRQLGERAIPLDISILDLLDLEQVRRILPQLRPQVLINTAAYTAVDLAEDNAATCFAINRDAVQALAETTAHINCRLVQISTDYVFGGPPHDAPRPWTEHDLPAPQGVYARAKLAGEQAARLNADHLIVRSCGLYGQPGPRSSSNFVTTMFRLGQEAGKVSVVDDQVCSPTWVVDLANALQYLIATGKTGLFHVTNQGATSWFEFAREIFHAANIDCEVVPISSRQYGAKSPRPRYSALDTSKYQRTGGPMPSTWDQALRRYLASLRLAP